jgi:hypothetical protein
MARFFERRSGPLFLPGLSVVLLTALVNVRPESLFSAAMWLPISANWKVSVRSATSFSGVRRDARGQKIVDEARRAEVLDG